MFHPLLTVSLFSTARGKKDGYFYERRPEIYGVLKGPNGNVQLERSGGLDYLDGGEERSAFPALLTPGSVNAGFCRMDNEDIKHLRGRHLEIDPGCTTCTSMTMRRRQHRRQDERETAGTGERSVCGPHWKIANGLPRVGVPDGCTAKKDTLWFRQSAVEQSQRNSQRSDGGHAVVVAWSLAFPQR